MKRIVFIVSACALLLSACAAPPPMAPPQAPAPAAPQEAPAAPAATEAPAAATEPKRGGSLVMARDSEPLSLNPIGEGSADNGSIFMIMQIFDGLVETQDSPLPQPALAESWTTSDDGLKWTFKLRPNVKWSDGEPLTCEDVKYSIDGFADPQVNTFYTGFGSAIESTECVDEATFVVNLSRVEGAFLDYLSTMPATIRPKAVYEKLGSKAFSDAPVGSGPFKVKEWVRGQRLVLERNPNYWKEGKPYLDQITVEYVPDENARMLKIQSGEAQIATEVPYSQIERIDALDGVSVLVEDVMAWDAVWFNVNVPPLNDQKVIQALNYAAPKEAMLKSLLYGAGDIANHVIARVKYWDETVPAYPYDLDKAKALMQESSSPNGFEMKCLIVAGNEAERQQAEILQQEWAKIGVKIDIEAVDISSIWDRWTSGKEACFTYPGSGLSSDALSDDNLAVVFFDYTGGASSFWTGWNNQQAIDLMKKASSTTDEKVRQEAFFEMQRLVMQEYPAVPLFFVKARTAIADNVKGFKTLPVKWWNLEEVWLDQ